MVKLRFVALNNSEMTVLVEYNPYTAYGYLCVFSIRSDSKEKLVQLGFEPSMQGPNKDHHTGGWMMSPEVQAKYSLIEIV